jgi:hypothetical protein
MTCGGTNVGDNEGILQSANSLVLVPFAIRCVAAQQSSSTRTPSPIIHGSFQLPEISAVGFVGNRLLVAADDPEKKHGYYVIDCFADPLRRLTAGDSMGATSEEQIYRDILLLLQSPNAGEPDPERISDLEDMAVAPTGDVYLITSHSLNKKDKAMPEQRQLLRVRFARGSTKPAFDGSLLPVTPTSESLMRRED